jgi:hypothetical protein
MRAASIAVAALACLAAGAVPAAAAPEKRPPEYRPASVPAKANGKCPRGMDRGALSRCFRPCRDGYVQLIRPNRDAGKERGRCFLRRPSRLWYRVAMTAKYDAEFTGAGGTSGETHHDWRFKSNGAVILFAQCTVANTDVDPPDARFQFHVVADVPCERQARFSGLDVVEDVSFGARGVVTGERYLDRRTVDIIWPRTAWYDTSGGLHDFRCPQPYTQIEQGTGPARVEATLGTAEGRSAFARGLALYDVGAIQPGNATQTGTEVECEDVPADAATVLSRGHYPATSQEWKIEGLRGRDLLERFSKTVGGDFGDASIRLSDTIGPVGQIQARATFVLSFTRCPGRKGRTPRGC